ncbi:MAG: hypothetical protein M3478_08250 [Planctomycetota bacterium]|nr:hypothetical protein [Planctomycetota bacterium]
MFGDGPLTLREFAMREPLPLATLHDAILNFLRNRDDAVLFGAQAVNAYVEEPRMTQDVDILSTRANALAEELRSHLAETFKIAARIREVAGGGGFRVYQLREPRNRHLADVRQVAILPPTRVVADVRVPIPEELIAQKVISLSMRSAQPKGDTDRRDVKVLLLAYPNLKSEKGAVFDRLCAAGANETAIAQWRFFAASLIESEDAGETGY